MKVLKYTKKQIIKNKQLFFPVLISSLLFSYAPQVQAFPRTPQELTQIMEQVVSPDLGGTSFPAITGIQSVSMPEGALILDNEDIVFIVPTGEEKPLQERDVLIIPRKYMIWHEVLNVIERDKSFAVTYSPVSGSLAVYNTMKNNKYLQLEYSGLYYNANTLLRDVNTNSLWSQLYGTALMGANAGQGLEILPCYVSTWQKVARFYKNRDNARVMATPRFGQQRYGLDPYGSLNDSASFYYNDNLIYPVNKIDVRLPLKTRIIGIERDGHFMAIEIDYIKRKKSVNFFMGSTAMLAIYDEALGIVRLFNRSVWNGKDPLIFSYDGDKLIDFQTRSEWSGDGICVGGNYLGAYMKEENGIYSFWYSWAAHNPETDTVPGDTVVPDSALETGISDNPLSKGLDGTPENSDLGLPWEDPFKSNYKK